MDACQIIEALGGRATVARATGVKVSTVISWEWRGFIPAMRLPAILRLIDSTQNCRVTAARVMDLIEKPAPRVRQRAA